MISVAGWMLKIFNDIPTIQTVLLQRYCCFTRSNRCKNPR